MLSGGDTDRAIADVRALLGADSDLVIAALTNSPLNKYGPPQCSEHRGGPRPQSSNDQERESQMETVDHGSQAGHDAPSPDSTDLAIGRVAAILAAAGYTAQDLRAVAGDCDLYLRIAAAREALGAL
jgi:hypothetical protein